MKSKAFVVSGPGYLEDALLEARLSAMGFELRRIPLAPSGELNLGQDVAADDLIFLRSSWEVSPANFLYARLLAKGLSSPLFDAELGDANKRPKVIAVGRSALSALIAGWGGAEAREAVLRPWVTHASFENSGWQKIRATQEGLDSLMWGLGGGRHFPDLSDVPDFEPVLQSEDHPFAWQLGRSFFSFGDCLSFFEPSQLEAFGYEALPEAKNNTELLRFILRGLEDKE